MAETTVVTDPKNLAPKPMSHTVVENGMPSPGTTPQPDMERVNADKVRREAIEAGATTQPIPEPSTSDGQAQATGQPQAQAPNQNQIPGQGSETNVVLPSIETGSAKASHQVDGDGDGDGDDDMTEDTDEDNRADPDEHQQRVIQLILDDNTQGLEKEMGLSEKGAEKASGEEKLDAIRKIAVLIHPKLIKGKPATEAWDKLKELGETKFTIHKEHLTGLEEWDGEDYVWSEFTAKKLPSPEALEIYKSITPFLAALLEDPENDIAHKELQDANGKLDSKYQIQTHKKALHTQKPERGSRA
ncbi:hypothetical protein LX32DRAFT_699973 [Colletotrichum zoysiae]|uniref:Uncharacterized protein n=1 Tax=Colletotrichum zoysiae TaxID=1216348 RepID=A0AAD9H311_9PEZI|nr:hypothetical protein LX32DRAFT_699973 [Colletotrichum zoysiae]